MAKKSAKKAERKRRSFYEPEAKRLTNWINDQKDLSLSMQLVIVDAIRNYGEGDVIEALISARARGEDDAPLQHAKPGDKIVEALTATSQAHVPAARKAVPVETLKPAANIPVPTVTEEATKPVVKTTLIPEEEAKPVQAPPTLTPEPYVAPPTPPVQESPPAEDAPVNLDEAPYDPLEIMFRDIGSGFNK